MARNYYSEINLHITWHVKGSAPLLVPKIEAVVHDYVRNQRERHSRGRLVERLERITALEDGAEAEPREAP